MKHKIIFKPYNKEIQVEDGASLIRTAMEAGVHINASCGGEGVCGKCRILLEKGEIQEGTSEYISDEDIKKGYYLACKSKIKSDLVVRIPIESEIDTKILNLKPSSRYSAKIKEFDLNKLKENESFIPPVEKKYIELNKPSASDNVADIARLMQHLKMEHNEHRLSIDLNVIRKFPDVLRNENFKITATIVRPVIEDSRNRIVCIESGDTSQKNHGVVIDVGTTTIFGQIINLNNGKVLSEYGEFNAQISYGEDVISRIMFARKENGLKTLHNVVIETINRIIKKIIKRAGISKHEITTITMAGNTTMTQLLLKINPAYIRLAPYVPASIFYPSLNASDIGVDLDNHTVALIYPGISSYVGGDIVAGVIGSGMYKSEELTLFMDIGTNAEIVIGNKDWMACTACSAGPAFEGGGITFGMRAGKGAIEDFSIDFNTYEPMIITKGNKKAKGICGSGLITIVAELFEAGVIDNRGKFNQNLKTDRIRKTNDIGEYVLVWKNATQIEKDITITEPDIDNFIRAKGAMYSGALTLLEEVGLTINSIDKIILAGGFGSYIDLEKAMTIGLLPEIDPKKVDYLGNGSLLGCKICCIANNLRKDVGKVVEMMTNFELAETPSYMNHYIGALFLPHTELNYFPKLKKRLDENRKIQAQKL